MNQRTILTILGTAMTVLLFFFIIGLWGRVKSVNYLDQYAHLDSLSYAQTHLVIQAAHDSLARAELSGLLDRVIIHGDEQYLVFWHNYPLLTSLTLISLVAAVVAAFLNLIAINKGWENVSNVMRTSLITTIFVFAITSYTINIFDFQKKVDMANRNFTALKKIRKDICQYAQTGGVDFFPDGRDLKGTQFFAHVHNNLYAVGEVRHGYDASGIPSPMEVGRMLNQHLGTGGNNTGSGGE